MRLLPLHPLPMRTLFSRCVLVNFAVDPEALKRKLPSHLEPELHEGRAYVSIVIAEMEKMRPAFFPKALGLTYNQVVYRAVVKCGQERGVTFLRSDADNAAMVLAGNAFTFFKFHSAKISWKSNFDGLHFSLQPCKNDLAKIKASYELSSPSIQMPASSRFSDLASAERFLCELYTAFGSRRKDGRVEVVRIERNPWKSVLLQDRNGLYEAMSSGLLFSKSEANLDSIFWVEGLRYKWDRLSLEPIPDSLQSHGK